MAFQPIRKATLLMPSGPASDPERLHLWIVLTDPCPMEANLIVSVSSIKEGIYHDPSCVIEAGEHRRIKIPSYVEYRRARTIHSAALVAGERAWLYHADEPITDDLFKRICDGLEQTEHIAPRLRRYFLGNGSAF
jgi:hypothetical protein